MADPEIIRFTVTRLRHMEPALPATSEETRAKRTARRQRQHAKKSDTTTRGRDVLSEFNAAETVFISKRSSIETVYIDGEPALKDHDRSYWTTPRTSRLVRAGNSTSNESTTDRIRNSTAPRK